MQLPQQLTSVHPLVFILYLWTLVWKGFGLWYGSKNNQKLWFVAMIVINTAGLLEIAYLFYFAKHRLTLTILVNDVKKTLSQFKP